MTPHTFAHTWTCSVATPIGPFLSQVVGTNQEFLDGSGDAACSDGPGPSTASKTLLIEVCMQRRIHPGAWKTLACATGDNVGPSSNENRAGATVRVYCPTRQGTYRVTAKAKGEHGNAAWSKTKRGGSREITCDRPSTPVDYLIATPLVADSDPLEDLVEQYIDLVNQQSADTSHSLVGDSVSIL